MFYIIYYILDEIDTASLISIRPVTYRIDFLVLIKLKLKKSYAYLFEPYKYNHKDHLAHLFLFIISVLNSKKI